MSQVGIIVALIFSLIIAVFAILNNQPVVINYLFNKVDVSAVIVILGAAFSGAFIVFLLGVYRQIKLVVKMRGLTADIKDRDKKLEMLSQEYEALLSRLDKNRAGEPLSVEGVESSGDIEAPGLEF